MKNRLVGRVLMAMALTAGMADMARAELITFDEFSGSFQGSAPFTSGSLTFSSSSGFVGVWTSPPNVGAYNGTPYLLDAFVGQLTVSRTDSTPFVLSSFDIALGWFQPGTNLNMDITYFLNGGGTASGVLPLTLAYQNFSPGLSVTSVQFDISDSPNGYISLDNIEIAEVPEPSTLLLLGTGLLAGARRLRRRRA